MTSKNRWVRACALALAAGAACAARTSAQTTATWLNAADGNWNDPTQWSTNPAFPNNGGQTYNVFITPTGAPYTVTLNQPITINDLHLTSPDAILDLTNNNLVTQGDYSQSGAQLHGGLTAGTMTVAGTASFTGSFTAEALDEVFAFHAQTALIFNPITTIDICDTDVYHDGSNCLWSGGNMTLNEGAHFHENAAGTFNMTSDGTLSYTNLGAQSGFINAGTIRKSAGSGVSFFSGVDLDNTGTVQVETGTIRADRPVQVSGSTLTGGKWKVLNGSTLDLVGANITTNQADITLDGAASSFAAINNLATNAAAGKLTIQSGRDFLTTGDFTNNGSITVGTGTTFQVEPNHDLTNYSSASKTLTGGTLAVSGILKFRNADIQVDAAAVTLDGAASDIQNTAGAHALDSLSTIAPTGSFTIQNGRNFTTNTANGAGGSFTVNQAGPQNGVLTVGTGSLFRVATGVGATLTNFSTGELIGGQFNLLGTLQFDGASINTVSSNITLSGGGSHIIDEHGNDAFQNLHTINPGGNLNVSLGQHLTVTSNLGLRGRLGIGPSGGPRVPSIVELAGGNFTQDPSGILDLDDGILIVNSPGTATFNGLISGSGMINANPVINGIISPGHSPGSITVGGDCTFNPGSSLNLELGGTAPGADYDQLTVLQTLILPQSGGVTLNVSLINGFAPAAGQTFDILPYNGRSGEFSDYNLPNLGAGLQWQIHYLSGELELSVVPGPGGITLALAAGALSMAARRRR